MRKQLLKREQSMILHTHPKEPMDLEARDHSEHPDTLQRHLLPCAQLENKLVWVQLRAPDRALHRLFGEVARQHEAWISTGFIGRSTSDVGKLHQLLGRVSKHKQHPQQLTPLRKPPAR